MRKRNASQMRSSDMHAIPPVIAILGAGSWGTAMAVHLARYGNRVLLWGHDAKAQAVLRNTRINQRYLPGIVLPDMLEVIDDLHVCQEQASDVIIAVPSHAFESVLLQLDKPLHGISWLTKGLSVRNNHFLSEVVAEYWGATYPVAIISGPSFAAELVKNLPTALTIASAACSYQKHMQTLLHHGPLRVYTSTDLLGVQWCGAVKNIIAIACGVSDGLGYGANARAALITRGLAEMSRLGKVLGALEETFMGLAGIGDMVLTCTDNQSRNRRFGLLLGQGQDAKSAEQVIGQVVEGQRNVQQVLALAEKYTIDMPICAQIHALLYTNLTAQQAAHNLMSRPISPE